MSKRDNKSRRLPVGVGVGAVEGEVAVAVFLD